MRHSLLLIALAAVTATGAAQDSLEVGSSSTCPECRIVFEYMVTLGDTAGPGILPSTILSSIVRDGDGNFWVTVDRRGEPPLVFDSSGLFLHAVGRRGGGPGEFRGAVSLATFGTDSIYVVDDGNARLSVYAPGTEQPVREVQVKGTRLGRFQYVVFPDRGLVVNAVSGTPERVGAPFHWYSPSGDYRRSFGERGASVFPEAEYQLQYLLAPAQHAGHFWAARLFRYRIESWDTGGKLDRVLRRETEWFPPRDRPVVPDVARGRPPAPFITSVREMSDGRLWVAIAVPSTNWKSGLEDRVIADGRRGYSVDWQLTFDTVIELIDPHEGTLVTSTRVPGFRGLFVDDGHVAGPATQPDGTPVVTVWHIHLHHP